jgi:hypothetical protein
MTAYVRPTFVTERETSHLWVDERTIDNAAWEDCGPCTALMACNAHAPGTAPATHFEEESLRQDAGYGAFGGTNVPNLCAGISKRYGIATLQVGGYAAFLAAMTPGHVAFAILQPSKLPANHFLRANVGTGFTALHFVYLAREGTGATGSSTRPRLLASATTASGSPRPTSTPATSAAPACSRSRRTPWLASRSPSLARRRGRRRDPERDEGVQPRRRLRVRRAAVRLTRRQHGPLGARQSRLPRDPRWRRPLRLRHRAHVQPQRPGHVEARAGRLLRGGLMTEVSHCGTWAEHCPRATSGPSELPVPAPARLAFRLGMGPSLVAVTGNGCPMTTECTDEIAVGRG